MENPKVKRKEQDEERLLVVDEALEEIFEALSAEDILEQMIEFYPPSQLYHECPLKLAVHTVHYQQHDLSYHECSLLLTDLVERMHRVLWEEARKD